MNTSVRCRYGECHECPITFGPHDTLCACVCHRSAEEGACRCPGCDSVNTSTEHLLDEYDALQHEAMGGFFRHNARVALNAVVDMLTARGVTEKPGVFFGPTPLRKMGDEWDRV